MKVRIQSDGTPRSMEITDAETGKTLDNVTRVDIQMQAPDRYPYAVVTIESPVVDLVADADFIGKCPHCGHAHACDSSGG